MSATDLVNLINQLLYVGVFVSTLVWAVQRPRRSTFDAALLFGDTAIIISLSWFFKAMGIPLPGWEGVFSQILLMALPYLLLRLVSGFATVPPVVMRLVELGLALCTAGLLLFQPFAVPVALLYVAYFVVVAAYAAVLVVWAARLARGVTRRRLYAVAAGAIFLGLVIALAGLQAALPGPSGLWSILAPACSCASGVSFLIGFAPPRWLRRAWQEPEVRAFLAHAADLAMLPGTADVTREIAAGTAAALGAGSATVGLWDEAAGVLHWNAEGVRSDTRPGEMTSGMVLVEQRPLYEERPARTYPEQAEQYRRLNVQAVMAAPITARDRRLGVLTAYTDRPSLFAEDDLRLLELLADQAAVILQSRALIDEAARVRAQAETNRLREDFLSAAAHDLRTPLTTVIGLAQLLRRRAERGRVTPEDVVRDADRIIAEGGRLRTLVLELLDAGRVEQGRLVGAREPVDLADLVRITAARVQDPRFTVEVEVEGPVQGELDRARVEQLLWNLVENAVKYSPDGGTVRLRVTQHGDLAELSVSDQGIGIPAEDLPVLFERFHRGSNVDDRKFAGMGLGLYICRGIVEQHGGTMRVESTLGQGTTFYVTLPLVRVTSEVALPV